MGEILKKQYLDIDVVEGAKDRIKHLMRSYDKVVVNFSGGKDSCAMLYVVLEVAKEINKLPVEVVYVDHEVEGNGTIELIDAVAKMPEVNLIRYAMPFSLRNASSFNAPMWYPWHPAEKDLWVRPLPEDAVTEIEGYNFEYDPNYRHQDGLPFMANSVKHCLGFQEIADLHVANHLRKGISTIALVGIRAQESMARYTIMTRKKNECYISSNSATAYPIYDWLATDVWKYIRDSGLPYNTEYDLMNKTEHYHQLNKQRVGSVFAEESLRTLHHWQEFYGEFWHKIIERAEGVKTAWRYNNDGMYTGTKIEKEADISWHDFTMMLLNKMPLKTKQLVGKSMNKIITWHRNQTDYPIADGDKDSCPLTGISWEFLARIAIRGDTKERNLQKVPQMSQKARKRNGLTRDEAVARYGSESYKKRYYEEQRKK
jgi:predicted phosphoadenosine phosphosulfate sulfurtransferase